MCDQSSLNTSTLHTKRCSDHLNQSANQFRFVSWPLLYLTANLSVPVLRSVPVEIQYQTTTSNPCPRSSSTRFQPASMVASSVHSVDLVPVLSLFASLSLVLQSLFEHMIAMWIRTKVQYWDLSDLIKRCVWSREPIRADENPQKSQNSWATVRFSILVFWFKNYLH